MIAMQVAFVAAALAAALAVQSLGAFVRSGLVANRLLARVDCSHAEIVAWVLAVAGSRERAKKSPVGTVVDVLAVVVPRACVHCSLVGIGTLVLAVAALALRVDCSGVEIVVVALAVTVLVACVGCVIAGTVVAARIVVSGE